MLKFYEFFAGGGMARAGLGQGWQCLFANDFDHKKGKAYCTNWGDQELKVADVGSLAPKDLPGSAHLVWASFPCQDLSLAGAGAGLKGERSGTFWPFWKLMKATMADGRAPEIIVLENVCGTLTSHGGKDFATICGALQQASYRFGALIIDAELFVPQSRPRLFIVAVREDVFIPEELLSAQPYDPWHTRALQNAQGKLPPKSRANWIWWHLPEPPRRNTTFADIIEENPQGVEWHTREETARLLRMMSDINRAKVNLAKQSAKRMVGGIYKRTRLDEFKRKVQRAEIRFDDISGCLRTPAGGSSRQSILVVQRDKVRSRLISSRETARLMGLPDDYKLPENYNEAYHLTGDGVVVPVVRHLAHHLFERILGSPTSAKVAA
ncbi:cytosine methyltransferase [Burkholderia phage vB_BceS_AH2]|uniref:Cytosine methyltransferase n=1 Tax=Burkholderia phage vB_BceS_AH2 TaxID=1133022 RepID=I6NLI4_9CAUD|nr:DNA methyltransferase [Burkholderia phage vB_BceS_AH2]AEY69545.1 cytosine methyltransferase [Burkholderia phage vB_BceS_AH2]